MTPAAKRAALYLAHLSRSPVAPVATFAAMGDASGLMKDWFLANDGGARLRMHGRQIAAVLVQAGIAEGFWFEFDGRRQRAYHVTKAYLQQIKATETGR